MRLNMAGQRPASRSLKVKREMARSVMRPVALVFGFAFMFYIMNIAFWFASVGMGTFLSGMLADVDIGPGAFVGVMAILIGTAFMLVRFVLKMITHLPDNLPRWIGGQGNNVGDMAAAEGANQGMAGTTKNSARGSFVVGRNSLDELQRKADRSQSDKQAAERDERMLYAQTGKTRAQIDAELRDGNANVQGSAEVNRGFQGGGKDLDET